MPKMIAAIVIPIGLVIAAVLYFAVRHDLRERDKARADSRFWDIIQSESWDHSEHDD